MSPLLLYKYHLTRYASSFLFACLLSTAGPCAGLVAAVMFLQMGHTAPLIAVDPLQLPASPDTISDVGEGVLENAGVLDHLLTRSCQARPRHRLAETL